MCALNEATFGLLPGGALLSESAQRPTRGELISEVFTVFSHIVLGFVSE